MLVFPQVGGGYINDFLKQYVTDTLATERNPKLPPLEQSDEAHSTWVNFQRRKGFSLEFLNMGQVSLYLAIFH